jgi:hypothetical protein
LAVLLRCEQTGSSVDIVQLKECACKNVNHQFSHCAIVAPLRNECRILPLKNCKNRGQFLHIASKSRRLTRPFGKKNHSLAIFLAGTLQASLL